MRKILISILLILLIVLAYFTIFQGISIGSFKILGTGQIIELNNELTSKIDEANRKIKTDLQAKKNELSQNVDDLLENKESYYRLANISTESQINEANTEEVYNIEYLWLRVGRHARNEGVNMKMDVMNDNSKETNIKNLSFTVVGKYVGIIDFISSLEDDSELNFRIDNFKMLPNGDNLQATFNVQGVRIKLENTTQDIEKTEEQQTEKTDVNQNTTNEENAQVEQTTNQNNNETTNNQVVQ